MVEASDLVTVALDQLLPRADGPESRLIEAMRYAALGPGRRIRPYFAIETARIERVLRRHGARFLDRVFTPGEQRDCMMLTK